MIIKFKSAESIILYGITENYEPEGHFCTVLSGSVTADILKVRNKNAPQASKVIFVYNHDILETYNSDDPHQIIKDYPEVII